MYMIELATKTMTADRTIGSQRAERETIRSLLGGEDECRGCPHKRVSPHRSRGQVWTNLLDTKSLQVGATFRSGVVVFVGCWTVRGKTEGGTYAREDDGGGIVAAWLSGG